METLILSPKTKEQVAVAKALKIDFETDKSPYDPLNLLKKFYKAVRILKMEKV